MRSKTKTSHVPLNPNLSKEPRNREITESHRFHHDQAITRSTTTNLVCNCNHWSNLWTLACTFPLSTQVMTLFLDSFSYFYLILWLHCLINVWFMFDSHTFCLSLVFPYFHMHSWIIYLTICINWIRVRVRITLNTVCFVSNLFCSCLIFESLSYCSCRNFCLIDNLGFVLLICLILRGVRHEF